MKIFERSFFIVICACLPFSGFATDYKKSYVEKIDRTHYCELLNGGIDITDLVDIKYSHNLRPHAVCFNPYLEHQSDASIKSPGCSVAIFFTGCARVRPPTGTATIGSAVTTCSADMYSRASGTSYGTAQVRCRVYGSPTGASSGSINVSVPASIVGRQEPYGGTVTVGFEYIAGRLGSIGTAMDFSYSDNAGLVSGISYANVTGVILVSN